MSRHQDHDSANGENRYARAVTLHLMREGNTGTCTSLLVAAMLPAATVVLNGEVTEQIDPHGLFARRLESPVARCDWVDRVVLSTNDLSRVLPIHDSAAEVFTGGVYGRAFFAKGRARVKARI
jgi:hypothetical protein